MEVQRKGDAAELASQNVSVDWESSHGAPGSPSTDSWFQDQLKVMEVGSGGQGWRPDGSSGLSREVPQVTPTVLVCCTGLVTRPAVR